jgi:hypothetical protein
VQHVAGPSPFDHPEGVFGMSENRKSRTEQQKSVSGQVVDFADLNVARIDDLVTLTYSDGSHVTGALMSFGASSAGEGWIRVWNDPKKYPEPEILTVYSIEWQTSYQEAGDE